MRRTAVRFISYAKLQYLKRVTIHFNNRLSTACRSGTVCRDVLTYQRVGIISISIT